MDVSERRKRLQEMKQQTGSASSSASASSSSARRAKLTQLKMASAQATIPEITSRVDTWLKNNETYFSNAQNRFSSENTTYRTGVASSQWLSTVSKQRENFQKEAESIKSVLDQYKDVFGAEYVDSVYKALDGNLKAQESIIEASKQDLEYWSQFANKDEYDTAQRYYGYQQLYAGKSYEDITGALNRLVDSEEKEWLKANRYSLLATASDFAEKSKYQTTYRGGEKFNAWSGTYTDTGYDDIMYDYINRDKRAVDRQALADIQSNASFLGLDNSERGEMKDHEIAIFNYLYATQGSETAYEYIKYLTSDLNARQREKAQEKWAAYAKESPVGSSVFSVLTSPLKGLSYIGQVGDFVQDGAIDQNAGYNKFSYINSAIRDEVSKTVEANWGGVGSFAYQTGMSMGDFLFTTGITGGSSALSLAVMGSGAAADTTISAKDRGLEDWQAFTLGTVAGVAEAAMEKIGLDALFDAAKLGKGAVGYILSNTFAEGGEEVGTDLINTLADLLIAQDKSELVMAADAYMAQGKSEFAAWALALADKGIETGLSFLGGAVSGGIMGSGGAVINTIGNAIQGADMKKEYGPGYSADLTAKALELDPNNRFAKKMQTKLDDGKTLSGRQVFKLAQQNETAMYENDVASIQRAVEQRLTELGEEGDVTAVAKAIAKQASGQELKHSEKSALKHSMYADRVVSELDPEHIRTGEYSSSWAEKIGTDRINVAEYNAEEYKKLIEALETETSDAETAQPAEVVAESEGVATQETVGETQTATTPENVTAEETATEATTEAEADENAPLTLARAAKEYGAQAGAMMHTYHEGQDVVEYDAAYSAAYEMGKSGVNLSYAMQSESTAYLTEEQRKLAHAAGVDASNATAKANDTQNKEKANGKTGRRKGVVKGRDVSIADLKKAFNDTQGKAYKLLSTYAEVTGVDIVLYNSEANADGRFVEAQGRFRWSEDTIYIDINAGLKTTKDVGFLMDYTMMRTFAHEFSHFIEKWNPIWYNEFRKVVFDTITERGENVDKLIRLKQTEGRSYDDASREVVAQAMVDILPDANFVEELATKHKNIFAKLLEMLKEFVADLKAHFASLTSNSPREANALKEQIGDSIKYVESIVKLFDKIAVEAVENYQMTVATEEVVEAPAKVEATAETEADGSVKTTEREHFTITDDAENKITSIKFDEKPSNAVRDILKANAFIFIKAKGEWLRSGKWYGKSSVSDVLSALDQAYQSETTAAESTVGSEFDSDGNPIYETLENRKPIEPVDLKSLKQLWAESDKKFGLTEKESSSLQAYVRGLAYIANERLRSGNMSDSDRAYIQHIVEGTQKFPLYEGRTYRNYRFKTEQAYNAFLEENSQGNVVELKALTSTSKRPNGYPLFGEFVAHIVFDEVSGRDIADTYGIPRQQEVLLLPGTKYSVSSVSVANDGHPIIFVKEIANNEVQVDSRGRTSGESVRSVSGVSEGEKSDGGRVLRDGRGTEADGKGNRSEILDADELSGEDKAEKPKTVRTKKSDWASHDVEWHVPGKKTPVAYSTRAASDLIEVLAEDNPSATIKELLGQVTYDVEAKKVLQQYIDAGYGNQVANEWFNHKKQEVKPYGKNADNQGTVQQPDTDRQGTARLLDELQAEDVQGNGTDGQSVGTDREEGSVAGRHDLRTDSADRDRGSDGYGESRDLRNDGLTDQTEELTETVEREIAQKSTVEPKGSNFVIGDSLDLPNGDKARHRANVDAIRLIKQLETEGRYATVEEQQILSKYVGWGGLDKAFGEMLYNRETRKSEMTAKKGWEKEFAELRALVDEGIISEQEYKDMSASTKNAHYTSVEVIKAMYDGLASLGFKGGSMLEPSSGVGNFVGAMPAAMSEKVNSWTMVELDRITGQIAKYLYPNADVRIQGFETANIPDNYMDVAIGNVPFGNFGVVDRSYPKRITKSIHNYFFAKSLDKVRPGGIVMFITSSFTMDSSDSAVRKYIMERADLLGAIRLPNTAFEENAGTEVVTDIIILQKRKSGTEYAGEDFLEAEYKYQYGTHVSGYFEKHPEMVLGKAVTKRGMYGANTLTYEPHTDKGTIGEQIREAFKNIKGEMSYPEKLSREKTNFAVERANKKTKAGGFVVNPDGSISKNENGTLVKVDADEKTAKRIAGMLSIRDAYRKLASYLQQGLVEGEIKKARKELNAAYDKFVKEHGYLNAPANKRAISGDPDRYSIYSLEHYDEKKKTAKKADIFTKDTISANKTVTHVGSVEEGVIASINLTGRVDTALIAKLTDKTVEDVTRDIIDSRLAFKTRNGGLVAREAYLSGNVRAKLREAEALVPYDADYKNNVEELSRIIPADIPYNEIYITPGSTFIPNEVYADFIAYMLGGRNNNYYGSPDVEVGRSASGEFKIVLNNKRLKGNYRNNQEWGTARKSFLDLIDAMMGSRTVKVNDVIENADGKKISVINEAETEAANEKVKAIQKEFEEWIWKDEDRRNALAKLYNETYNAFVTPKYDGSSLSVNGINPMYSLMEHQANAVHRIVSSGGNTLLAHRVGAGKTLEMAAAAMKLRELGVVKKPVFVVPKNVVAQWGVEFSNYFPAAKLLVADDKSFTPANRKVFTNMIANGDYDAVIVTYEQFEKIPMSAEYQAKFYEEQISEIIAAIAEEKAESRDGKGLTVKEMEKKKAQLEKKLKELTSKPKDEDNIDFEMLGIDSLFVDEAHNFKNLEYVSKMTNVAGLGSTKGAQRAFDLYTKIRYLQGLNGGRGIVFATATPVMNSMVELYIMQKYLQPDVLNQLGLKSFDAWAKQFGEVVNKWEINPSGTGMRQKQVFANFRNLNELQLLFRSFTDVVTELPYLKIPKMKGGAVKIVECEPGEFQRNYMKALQKRAENVKNVDPSEDNMLKITSDGRKVSYTQRMIDPTLPYEPDCKIFRAGDNIVKEYQESADVKGTQIVFLDMATPKGTDKSKAEVAESENSETSYDEGSAKLYEDMRNYLVKKGIPKREIAFIHEADTDAKRTQLFEDVNEGKVRVLIGSTGKMGVGMNAQKRVVAIHHLDAPWRPGDVEQRDGRAFRQKNINEEVSKYVYVTKGSFDSRLWDILDRKQHFISQIMNGEDVGRTAEDTGEVTLSAAEVKALASGNPLIEEQTKLTDEIKKLENLQKAYSSSMRLAKTKLSDDITKIANYESSIEKIREDISARKDTYSDGKFSMNIGGKQFTDKKEAGVALAAEIAAKANKEAYVTVAKFAGFEIRVIRDLAEYKGVIHGKENYKFNVYMNNTTRMVNHIGEVIAGFENMIESQKRMIAEATVDRDAQQKILAQPFEKQEELAAKRARFNEVMELLAPKNEEQLGKTDDDTVQEQSRAYLDDYTQEQLRTTALNDREVFAMAADALEATELPDAERDALKIFKSRLSRLEGLQEERAKLGKLYQEQQFGANVDREAAKQTFNRMQVLDDQIKKAKADVLSLENKEVLASLLKKARKVVENEQRAHDAEILKRLRDREKEAVAVKKYRERIKVDVGDLTSWILSPNNKDVTKHVPIVLKDTVVDFLASIDFTSKQQLSGKEATKADKAFDAQIAKLYEEVAKVTKKEYGERYSDYTDIPPEFVEGLESYIAGIKKIADEYGGESVINKMSSEELKNLAYVVKVLKKFIVGMNKFHHNAVYRHVYEAGDALIEYTSEMESDGGKTGALKNFVHYKNARPAVVFERFGRPGMAIWDGLQEGQDQFGFNAKKIVDFAEKTFKESEVKAFREELHTFGIGGEKVTMRASHIMGLYCLWKQPDSKRHILEGGLRVGTFKQKGNKKVYSSDSHILTQGEVEQIIGKLTQRQKEVADAIQKFMAEQGAEWGNEISVKRFGEMLFTETSYYPIAVDKTNLSSRLEEFPEGASLYALLNKGFTKARNKEAANRIMLYDIFDVFANHMSSMAQYNAFALPVLDATKWLDYQQKTETGDGKSVREELTRVFGSPVGDGAGYAVAFIENILKDINGTGARGDSYDNAYLKLLQKANRAIVSVKIKTALLQPLAIIRAGLIVDAKSILSALNPADIKQNTEEMLKYSGIAAWKDLGFYDVNISRGMHNLITQDADWRDKFTEKGLWLAEKMDSVTWAAMWGAAKKEVIRKQGLKPSDEGFFEATKKIFEEVIYKTQVVDSVLTKSELMRSKGGIARTAASFMGESVATVSMLMDAAFKLKRDGWAKGKDYFARACTVYVINAVITALLNSLSDAWFDDDEYEDWYEKVFDALGGNLLNEIDPLLKIPYVGNVWESILSVAKTIHNAAFGTDFWSYSQSTVLGDIAGDAAKGFEILVDKLTGKETKYSHWAWIYELAQAASSVSGVPVANLLREGVGIWNNTVGTLYPDLKWKTYDSGDKNEIKYAYQDGYLTAEEATELLLEQGLVDNEDEAYFIVQGWEAGEGYSRYDELDEALKSGTGFNEAMQELLSHGITEKDIQKRVKTKAGEWYKGGEVSKQQATNMLNKYTEMSDEEITKLVNQWSSVVVTGIEYDEIDDEFMDGKITASRAIEMYVRYGGMTKEKATEDVTALSFVKDHPSLEGESVSYSFVEAYNEYCEPQGIDVKLAHDVLKFKGSATSDVNDRGKVTVSARKKVLEYIDTLDLSRKQKDALYYACGYAKSTIKEAPWR